jgi:hypothetical protein
MLRINFYKKNGEWTGVHYLDSLPRDVDKLALSLLSDYFADYYRISLQ